MMEIGKKKKKASKYESISSELLFLDEITTSIIGQILIDGNFSSTDVN